MADFRRATIHFLWNTVGRSLYWIFLWLYCTLCRFPGCRLWWAEVPDALQRVGVWGQEPISGIRLHHHRLLRNYHGGGALCGSQETWNEVNLLDIFWTF